MMMQKPSFPSARKIYKVTWERDIYLKPGKNDSLMGKINANVFASEYQLYFLDKKLLQDKLKEWIAEEDEG